MKRQPMTEAQSSRVVDDQNDTAVRIGEDGR